MNGPGAVLLLTIILLPSHSAVLTAWSFACGLPGKTARITSGQAESLRKADAYSGEL